jgi:hypothetical protein
VNAIIYNKRKDLQNEMPPVTWQRVKSQIYLSLYCVVCATVSVALSKRGVRSRDKPIRVRTSSESYFQSEVYGGKLWYTELPSDFVVYMLTPTGLRDVAAKRKEELVLKEPRNRLRKTDVLSGIRSNPSK